MKRSRVNWKQDIRCHQCHKEMRWDSPHKVWADREGFPAGTTRTLCSEACVTAYYGSRQCAETNDAV